MIYMLINTSSKTHYLYVVLARNYVRMDLATGTAVIPLDSTVCKQI